jgi:cell division initiation protein
MRYSGMDIQLKDFNKTLRGYDVNEVRDFLEDLAKQMETLAYENKVLRDKIREKELLILEYRDRESMLKDTMHTAQRVTEDLKKDATREATQLMTQAKLKAEAVTRKAQQDAKAAIEEVNRLKKHKMELAAQIRSTLETHLRLLDKIENEEKIAIDINIPTKR